MRSTLFVLFLAIATLSSSRTAGAATGDLDPTFGVGGVARTTYGASGGSVVARQSDGKLLVAGLAGAWETEDIAVARFDANGVLDPTFNGTGHVTTDIGAFRDNASQVLIQSDGKIVVVGTTDTAADGSTADIVLVRYESNGTLDGGFGTGGIVITNVSAADRAMAAALQIDQKLVVVGGTGASTFDELIARYATDGTLDPTFGTGGIVTLDFAGRGDQARDVVVQPDGFIIIAGTSFNGPLFFDGAVATLTRLDGVGTPDATFGTDGSVVFSPQPISVFNAVVRQPDGKLVVLGATGASWGVGFRLFRFDTVGAPDEGFTGATIPFFITNIDADALALAADGKFVVTGFSVPGFQSVRANADGTLDASYGNGGWINDTIGTSSVSIGALVEPSSDVVIVGASQLGPDSASEMTVTRVIGTAPACASDVDCGVCEHCGSGGTCEIGARSDCAVAAPKAAQLSITSKGLAKSTLALSWKGTVPAVDPLTTDSIGVCLFHYGWRELKAIAPANGLCDGVPCWKGSFATKLKYKDTAGTPHGIRRAAISGKQVLVKAGGIELATSPQGLPILGSLGPPTAPVVLQIHGSNGACMTATFDTRRKLSSGKFRGKND